MLHFAPLPSGISADMIFASNCSYSPRVSDDSPRRAVSTMGYTFVEILVVAGIIALLSLIGFYGYAKYKQHAEKVQCMSQMRAVHQGLADYVADKGHWPQPPMAIEQITEESWFGWWVATLEPYGVPAEAWICPTDKVEAGEENVGQRGSYIATVFDSGPWTPFRWNQPWLMERGDMHGKGAHIIFPRGEIITSQETN
jgi:type II secretory pathway pseudopilin PulG